MTNPISYIVPSPPLPTRILRNNTPQDKSPFLSAHNPIQYRSTWEAAIVSTSQATRNLLDSISNLSSKEDTPPPPVPVLKYDDTWEALVTSTSFNNKINSLATISNLSSVGRRT